MARSDRPFSPARHYAVAQGDQHVAETDPQMRRNNSTLRDRPRHRLGLPDVHVVAARHKTVKAANGGIRSGCPPFQRLYGIYHWSKGDILREQRQRSKFQSPAAR